MKTVSKLRAAQVRPGFDAPYLINVSNPATDHDYVLGATSVRAAVDVARALRTAGCAATVRAWSDGAYHEVYS